MFSHVAAHVYVDWFTACWSRIIMNLSSCYAPQNEQRKSCNDYSQTGQRYSFSGGNSVKIIFVCLPEGTPLEENLLLLEENYLILEYTSLQREGGELCAGKQEAIKVAPFFKMAENLPSVSSSLNFFFTPEFLNWTFPLRKWTRLL